MRKIIYGMAALALIAAPATLALATGPGQTVIRGTTAGRAVCAEPARSSVDKRAYCWLDGYLNTTATPQRYSFPIRFSVIFGLAVNTYPPVAVDRASISLPSNMTAPLTGSVVIEGY